MQIIEYKKNVNISKQITKDDDGKPIPDTAQGAKILRLDGAWI